VYEAVIFDVDGVLVRSDHLDHHRAAVRRAFAAHEVGDPAEADVAAMALGVTLPALGRVADAYGLDPAAFWATRDHLASAAQIESVADGYKQPYADAAVVRNLDRPAAAVSTNQQTTLDFLFTRFGFAEHFVGVHGRAPTLVDLRRKKPAPYFVRRALGVVERARDGGPLDPEQVLMVGDSESDVRAAHAAGVDAAFVRREHRRGYALGADPEYELAGLDELPALLDDGP
jgi:phosphoglycolate phosphatase-like HAD superfamily hydrolase